MARYGFMSSRFDRRSFLGTGAALVASGLVGSTLVGCGKSDSAGSQPSSAAAPMSPADLEAAAKKEGSVRIYVLDQGLADTLVAGFSKKYSWAKVESVVGSQTDLRNRAITESVAHAETADVLTLSNAHRKALLDSDIVRAVDIHEETNYPAGVLDKDHYAHPLYQYVVLYVFNKNLTGAAPTSIEDLADPSWRGKVSFDMPQNASTATTFLVGRQKAWGQDRWMKWLQEVKDNNILITPNASTALANVQSGERALGLSSSQDALSLDPGSPAKPAFYQDLIPVVQYSWLTTKGAHPNCGQLFVEWSMSPDGQQAVAASTRAPVLDIDTPVSLSKTLPPGSTIMAANQLDDYYANPQPFLDALDGFWPA
jgi:ABC-type Fe3+ transport system substrate-binding protein